MVKFPRIGGLEDLIPRIDDLEGQKTSDKKIRGKRSSRIFSSRMVLRGKISRNYFRDTTLEELIPRGEILLLEEVWVAVALWWVTLRSFLLALTKKNNKNTRMD